MLQKHDSLLERQKLVENIEKQNEIFCGPAVPSQRALRQCGELRFHLLCSYKGHLNSDMEQMFHPNTSMEYNI